MNALVVYDPQFGNTEQIARAIAATLSEFGKARAVRVDPTQLFEGEGVDVLIRDGTSGACLCLSRRGTGGRDQPRCGQIPAGSSDGRLHRVRV